MYSPAAARWMSKDPIGFESGDVNLYQYLISQPVKLLDPSGLVHAIIINVQCQIPELADVDSQFLDCNRITNDYTVKWKIIVEMRRIFNARIAKYSDTTKHRIQIISESCSQPLPMDPRCNGSCNEGR